MSYCEGFFKLKAELAIAEQADKLEARVSQLSTRVGALDAEAATKATDPQSQMLASLTGRSTEEIQLGLTLLIALLVELGASLGFYTAFSYWRIFDVKGLPAPEPVRVPVPAFAPVAVLQALPNSADPELRAAQLKTDVELYFEERVGRENGSSVTALALYDDYCQWCEVRGQTASWLADLHATLQRSRRAKGKGRRPHPLYGCPAPLQHGRGWTAGAFRCVLDGHITRSTPYQTPPRFGGVSFMTTKAPVRQRPYKVIQQRT